MHKMALDEGSLSVFVSRIFQYSSILPVKLLFFPSLAMRVSHRRQTCNKCQPKSKTNTIRGLAKIPQATRLKATTGNTQKHAISRRLTFLYIDRGRKGRKRKQYSPG